MNAWAQGEGQPGLGYIIFEVRAQMGADAAAGKIAAAPGKGIGPHCQQSGRRKVEVLRSALGLRDGDAVFFVAGEPAKDFVKFAGAARTKIGEELGLIAEGPVSRSAGSSISRCTSGTRRRRRSTSPITRSPCRTWRRRSFWRSIRPISEKILGLKAIQYDIVCNGVELSSGAIRNHRPDVMKKAFAIAGYDETSLEQKFGGMLHALSLGAPPHGGIAPGVDRIVMLLCGEENLREVVLFPMNQRAEDLLMGAPSDVTPKQLRELHIRLNLPGKE